jgi:uncharacterized protein YjiS (DUF1127 family)
VTPTFTPFTLTQVTLGRAAKHAVRILAGQAGRLVDAWRLRREARLSHLALSSLDNRTLHDLGIDRSELSAIVWNPADRDRAGRQS